MVKAFVGLETPVRYINRAVDTYRREYMESQFKEVGIERYLRVEAYTGGVPEKNAILDNVTRAAVSHILALNSVDFDVHTEALILEDDVVLTTANSWGFTFLEFCNRLPKDYGSVQLYKNTRAAFKKTIGFEPYTPIHYSTLAYLIKKDRALTLLDRYIVKNTLNIDLLVNDMLFGSGIYMTDNIIYSMGTSYSVSLFSTEEFESTICEQVSEDFIDNSRFVVCSWEKTPYNLDELFKQPK